MKHIGSKQIFNAACLVTAAIVGLGCAVSTEDATVNDEPVGTAEEAFSNGWYWRTWYANTDFDTGLNPTYWTCFLAGAGGFLMSGIPYGKPSAYVGAMIEGGKWHHVARNAYEGWYPSEAEKIGSSIMCVPAPSTIGLKHWVNYSGTTPALQLASASDPNLVCGLVALENGSNWDGTWSHRSANGLNSGDSAYVFKSGGYWYLGGVGQAEAWATCIDHPTTAINQWTFNNPSGSGTSSNFYQADLNYTQCFLAGFGGNFGSDLGPGQQGSWLGYQGSNLMWSETTSGQQAIRAYCIQ